VLQPDTGILVSLYLDVWGSANATEGSNLPVRVWVYGGAEDPGGISDPVYDGRNVAQDDALLVSINYRPGPLGFLAATGTDIQGNQGIQDLLLGLQWIQSNIAAFGGDPVRSSL
jgi:carboxylesterase type B